MVLNLSEPIERRKPSIKVPSPSSRISNRDQFVPTSNRKNTFKTTFALHSALAMPDRFQYPDDVFRGDFVESLLAEGGEGVVRRNDKLPP